MKNTVFVAAILTLTAFRVATGQSNLQERNKEVIRECNGKANRGDIKGQNACFADQITFQGRAVTRESLLANLEDIQTTFPDYYSEIVDIIADGDVVVTRNRVSGTHKGVAKRTVNGGMLVGVQPTGKRFSDVQNIRWYKLRDGKIVEHYATRDDMNMMRQLGVLPPPPSSGAR